ncbi:MAG: ABC transporter permease subunit [Eubacteriales bacterium]|nr:ABC transporter permease subunit [Eubacteriales bacterium]
MKAILQFECLKFWYAKKNLVVLLVFLASLLAMITYNIIQDNNYWAALEVELNQELALIQIEGTNVHEELEMAREAAKAGTTPNAEVVIAELEKKANFLQWQRVYCCQQSILAGEYSKDKAQEKLELWIARDQHLLNGFEEGLVESISILAQSANPLEIEKRLVVNQALLRDNIEPLNSPYEMTAANFLYRLTSFPWILIVVITLMLLSMDLFSADIEGGAYKVLYSQSHKRNQVHAVKFSFNIVASIVLVTGFIALAFGLLSLGKGLGDINYPTFYLEGSYAGLTAGSSAADIVLPLVPWSAYIAGVIPIYLLMSCFTLALTGTASLLLGSTANALSAVICLLFLDYSFRILFPTGSSFYLAWPFAALGFRDVFQGYYIGSALAYLALLGGCTLLLLTLSLVVLKKQDLKGGTA